MTDLKTRLLFIWNYFIALLSGNTMNLHESFLLGSEIKMARAFIQAISFISVSVNDENGRYFLDSCSPSKT